MSEPIDEVPKKHKKERSERAEQRREELHALAVEEKRLKNLLLQSELESNRLHQQYDEVSLRDAIATAEEQEHDAAIRKIEREAEERDALDLASGDYRNQTLWFDVAVTGESVRQAIGVLRRWHRENPSCDIEVIINSPGGDVMAGMALFDEITSLSIHGGGSHFVTTKIRGLAASMGAILSQAGDARVMGPEGYLMIHEASTLTWGKVGQIKDEIGLLDRMSDRVTKIFTERSAGKTKPAAFKKLWDRKDAWLTSEEALKHGFIDTIG